MKLELLLNISRFWENETGCLYGSRACILYYIYILILLLLFPISCAAQRCRNVSLGSSLRASDDDSVCPSWVTLSGDFAFGFSKFENQGFLPAIRFNRIPKMKELLSGREQLLTVMEFSVGTSTQRALLQVVGSGLCIGRLCSLFLQTYA